MKRTALIIAALAAGCASKALDRSEQAVAPLQLRILAFNDFHGNLLPPAGGWKTDKGVVATGGAAYLATHLAKLRAGVRNSVTVSAGDLVGASPLLSALFHDEATIEAMDLIGLELNGVGNHEFDEGPAELLRLAHGGCHPQDGCRGVPNFPGAKFPFLAANVRRTGEQKPIFEPYVVRSYEGVDVAFVGMTLEGTSYVVPPVVTGLDFADEADTVNALVPELRARGIEVIVVVLHEGGFAGGGYRGCENVSGPIVEIAQRLDPAVDVVVSGHTHRAYVCEIDGKVVTSAGSFGRLFTVIDLEIDRTTKNVIRARPENRLVTHDVEPDPRLDALIRRYSSVAEPLEGRVIGQATQRIVKASNEAGETPLGGVIADAQLAITRAPDKGAAVVAFMNIGGIRADLETINGNVTFGQAFTVQPFGNMLLTLTMTGAQIHELLEQQFAREPPRILQVSQGFSYEWRAKPVNNQRVDPESMRIGGQPVDLEAKYQVTVNDFMANRGVLENVKDRKTGPPDIDALEAYFRSNSPVSPPAPGRIRRAD